MEGTVVEDRVAAASAGRIIVRKNLGLILLSLLIALPSAMSPAFASGRVVQGPMFPAQSRTSPDSTPAVVGSYIAMVLQESSTPCFNCVNGGEQGTFGSGDPIGFVTSSESALGILFVYYNISFNGSCSITIKLTQGTTTLATGSGSFSPTPAINFSLLRVTRQSTWHGAATMTGQLVCGGLSVTNTGKVRFQ